MYAIRSYYAFVNADDNNFHLLAASPCVNVGDNTAAVSAGLTTDFDGQDRIIGGIVDMGADEVSDFTGPITSNVAVSTNPAPIGTLVNITATVDDFTTGESNAPASQGSVSDLVINEWLADSLPGEQDWLELHNTHPTLPVPLRGLHLAIATTTYRVTRNNFV